MHVAVAGTPRVLLSVRDAVVPLDLDIARNSHEVAKLVFVSRRQRRLASHCVVHDARQIVGLGHALRHHRQLVGVVK